MPRATPSRLSIDATPPRPRRSAAGYPAALWLVLLGSLCLPLVAARAADSPPAALQRLAAPAFLGGYPRRAEDLGQLEQRYFQRYGASASRSVYGPHGLYLVRTAAPLRHLHAPEICLRGLGHRVRFLGTRYDGVPSSVFESIDQDGHRYLVSVSYRSAQGAVASSIAEVIWRWARAPQVPWTMIQRISPADLDASHFEGAVQRAFNLLPTVQ